jgi:hypothetical protein
VISKRPGARLSRFEQIDPRARIVIGLLSMGYDETDHVAVMALATSRYLLGAFIDFLLTCRHPLIIAAIDNGLPPYCAVEFPTGCSIRCPSCKKFVTKAPCVTCALKEHGWTPLPDELGWNKPMLPPSVPTQARPGSAEKIEIMRQRVERGEAPCHPLDARISSFLPTCDTVSILP